MARIKNKARDDGRLQSKVYIGTKNGKKQYISPVSLSTTLEALCTTRSDLCVPQSKAL